MEKKAHLSILAAATLWGCLGAFVKLTTSAGLTSMQGVALRSIVAAVLYGTFLAVTNPKALKINPRHWYYFFGTGVCSMLFFNWCYFNAIATSSLAVAAVLLYTSPIFVMLMSALLFREVITPIKVGALLVTFLGCMLVTGLLPMGQQSVSVATILFGLGSGFGYALYSICCKYALAIYPPSTVTFYTVLFSAVFSLPLAGLPHNLGTLFTWQAIAGSLGMGLICTILPLQLYSKGLRHVEAGKAAIMASLEPFVAALLGVIFFHEAFTPYKILGMLAIFGAILLLNRKEKGTT